MERTSHLAEYVHSRGGMIRTEPLRERRFGRRAIEEAIRAGVLVRPRRGWVAVPTAEPILLSAARDGVVLTCVTQARRMGLWVHGDDGLFHVACAPHVRKPPSAALHVHWARPLVPRPPDTLIDPIENVLSLIAECEPPEQALATWDSALNKGLVTIESLSRLPLRPAARRILADATPYSDAGTETYLRQRLRWLHVPLRIQIWIAGHRVDALLGKRLILQIDGGHHVGAQRTEDNRHDAQLLLMGYHVIRISYVQMMHDWPAVQELIMSAVAQGLHDVA